MKMDIKKLQQEIYDLYIREKEIENKRKELEDELLIIRYKNYLSSRGFKDE